MTNFQRSKQGFFKRSKHGFRNRQGDSILIVSLETQFIRLGDVRTHYLQQGRTVDGPDTSFLERDPFDYQLIFLWRVLADPPWWGQIVSGGWKGRIVLIGENAPAGAGNPWINSKSSITGMSLISGSFDDFPQTSSSRFGPFVAHPLTAGLTSFFRDAVSKVVGGTPLATLVNEPGVPFVAENTVNEISWVVSGDLNCFSNQVGQNSPMPANPPFLNNLYSVEVGE